MEQKRDPHTPSPDMGETVRADAASEPADEAQATPPNLGPLPDRPPIDLFANPEHGEPGRQWRRDADALDEFTRTTARQLGRIGRRARF